MVARVVMPHLQTSDVTKVTTFHFKGGCAGGDEEVNGWVDG